ncbi:MAG: response regulator transcription factor [Bacteroidota bacterium]
MCKIAILESCTLFSSGITKILNEVEDFNVISETEKVEQMQMHLGEIIPDVIVFDILNHPNGGIKPIKKIRRLYPKTPLLLIVSEDYGFYFEEYIYQGVRGLILSSASCAQFIKAIQKLENGEDYIKTDIWNILKDKLRSGKPGFLSPKLKPQLSDREVDVAKLFCEGLSYKEIGGRLNISPRTVETHRNNILSKLNLNSLADLIKYTMSNSI